MVSYCARNPGTSVVSLVRTLKKTLMKKLYTTLFLITVSVFAFSQPYFIYTAKKSGYWYVSGNWNVQPRTDGVNKHKIIIPAAYSIILDNNVNSMGLGDIEVVVSGGITIVPNTTLNLSSNSSIQLNNGSITGNAANQQIIIGSTVKYKGDIDGVKTGYSIADNTTGTSPNGFRAFALLPVSFTSFYISRSDNNIALSWSTDREMNNSHYEVERSIDGREWKKIAMFLGAGTTNNVNTYTYTDRNISNPVIYYRIRQVDISGRSVYSSVKTIRGNEAIPSVKIYGYDKNVVIDFNTAIKNSINVTVLNNSGQIVSQQSFNNPSYRISMSLHGMASGAYVVQITDAKGWSEVKKVVL